MRVTRAFSRTALCQDTAVKNSHSYIILRL